MTGSPARLWSEQAGPCSSRASWLPHSLDFRAHRHYGDNVRTGIRHGIAMMVIAVLAWAEPARCAESASGPTAKAQAHFKAGLSYVDDPDGPRYEYAACRPRRTERAPTASGQFQVLVSRLYVAQAHSPRSAQMQPSSLVSSVGLGWMQRLEGSHGASQSSLFSTPSAQSGGGGKLGSPGVW
jgi:hypothetical protein